MANVFVKRLWRSVKYEDISSAKQSLGKYFEFYNTQRRHQSLDRHTPDQVYYENIARLAA